MNLSVVIPARNEAENIETLLGEIRAALDGGTPYEIVVVDDASDDGMRARLVSARTLHPMLRTIRLRERCGQSTALVVGVRAARGTWIATLDGDGQNDPADIPHLLALCDDAEPRTQLIAGYRRKRRDTWLKRVSSRVANAVRRGLLHDQTPDTGCGLKLFARESFLALPYFDHMHRYLPALMLRAGGTVQSVEVQHRPRGGGRSHYGVHNRLWVGIVDLFGVRWLIRRSHRPVIERED
jgi:dolichol-phosphate mannosyltransferase